MSKNILRKAVLQERKALSRAEVTGKSNLIVNKVLTMEEYLQAATVMVYLDFRNEVQTGTLVSHSMKAGKRVVVPVTEVKERKLIPSLIVDYPGDLQPGNWGILEPKPQCLRPVEPGDIDIIFVPGVAFDVNGNRLGYGGGYYDRFLARLSSHSVFIALAFELQVRRYVYPAAHDIPVHYLVTEKRLLRTMPRVK
ncbi:MAG: putative 5-formyltetrahydrofolate cyclo-ligase [Pelotomaculum sp. PtaB.Bin013]|uniref:5-formyltetrahydrofolate cyclo-ligase n=1 Tax=Pelotomaculum isophthalicicum JI TaxID=947010 RepID=A0A9X4JUG0_9FIRM|nr:5-formyltetrahydrofolate cyclo-ligase [Pelotomaculum isophthalicicum]MDF9409175.1 5-formyltetrahydrofolate cyclo-ligase [Pelotomaculum isophthalicicum JI]OPX90327.1 MAG: putative 5-formyltetrahydrofolate cyclo-ligase [Pelotomaculum sp. PtaB.Bin013]